MTDVLVQYFRNVPDELKTDLLVMVSSSLIRLNRDQEAYNYLKHWMSRYTDQDLPEPSQPKIFWNKIDHDLLEAPQVFIDESPSAAVMGTFFLLKLRFFLGLRTAQEWKKETGVDMDQEAIDVGRKSGLGPITKELIENGKLEGTINQLRHQLGQIYISVEVRQSDFWTQLPLAHQDPEPRHDGSGLEIYPELHCYRAFAETERGLESLQKFNDLVEMMDAAKER